MKPVCHCGKSVSFQNCCGRFLNGSVFPKTAEELMRSRYSAFVEKNYQYLFKTHDPDTLTQFDLASNSRWAEGVQFYALKVIRFEEKNDTAIVEFAASYLEKKTGLKQVHHETSQFKKVSGKWYYSSSL